MIGHPGVNTTCDWSAVTVRAPAGNTLACDMPSNAREIFQKLKDEKVNSVISHLNKSILVISLVLEVGDD